MANNAYVTTRKWMSAEQIEKDIEEILERRFSGKLGIVERWTKALAKAPDASLFWCEIKAVILYQDCAYQFTVELLTRRRLSFRHPPNDWAMYASSVVQTELAVKYSGMHSDSGIEDRWKPDLNKFTTYTDWVAMMTKPRSPDPKHIAAVAHFREMYLAAVPDPLKEL